MGVRSTNEGNAVSQVSSQTSGPGNLFSTVGPNERAASPYDATGGTKSTPGDGYVYHVFTSSGSWQVNSAGGNVDYVLIAGGGGGGWDRGGGGGAGAFRPVGPFTAVVATHPITIGAGGAGGSAGDPPGHPQYPGHGGGKQGGQTTASYNGTNYDAGGGGGGGGTGGQGPGIPGELYGGSGGGAGGGPSFDAGDVGGPAPFKPYGNTGKLWAHTGPTFYFVGGAGGGAGSGASPTIANPYPFDTAPGPGEPVLRANASDGATLPWIPTTDSFGEDGMFAGGGAGGGGVGGPWGRNQPYKQKAKAGRGSTPTIDKTDAMDGTGSGGGGGAGGTSPEVPNKNGGDGANGCVLFRYPAG